MTRSMGLSHFLYLLLLLILSILLLNTNIYAAPSTNLGTSYVSKQVYSIADFCEMFISHTTLEQGQSCIAMNEDSLSEELTTALEALSYMSSRVPSSSKDIEFIPVQDLSLLESKQYVIYIENLMDLPSTYKDLLTASEIAQAENEALLKLITTSSGQKVLIVTGNNSTALINAGRMFGNEAFLSKLTSTSKFIEEDENILTPDTGVQEYYPLTENGVTVSGAFKENTSFYVDVPSNRMLATGSEIFLDLSYADDLDFDKSSVNVYINDTFIGEKALSSNGALDDSFTLKIPASLNVSGGFTVYVTFDLALKDSKHNLSTEDMPWAYISPESYLKANTIEITDMHFESYPSPFIRDHSFSNVITLIPDVLTSNDYAALSGIFRTLGHYLKNNLGVLEVKKVSEEYELADKNIIALGTFNENIYVSTLNSQLYYKFSMDGTTILPPENLEATEIPDESLGICQLIKTLESSDNELGYGILVVSGCSDLDLLNAASYLSSKEGLQNLYGNGYIATNTALSCYRIKEDITKKKIAINSKLGSKEFSLFQMTSKMVLVFLLLSTILLINKHRKRVVHEK